jgi:hypothetical protein
LRPCPKISLLHRAVPLRGDLRLAVPQGVPADLGQAVVGDRVLGLLGQARRDAAAQPAMVRALREAVEVVLVEVVPVEVVPVEVVPVEVVPVVMVAPVRAVAGLVPVEVGDLVRAAVDLVQAVGAEMQDPKPHLDR